MSYNAKPLMFASLPNGGHLQIKELTDFPGVTVTDKKENRKSIWVRTITFDGKEYDKIEDAVEAYKQKESNDQAK